MMYNAFDGEENTTPVTSDDTSVAEEKTEEVSAEQPVEETPAAV